MTTEDRARRCAVVERLATSRGELALRSCGDHYEIISNGVFLMDTRGGDSERLLVRAALTGVDRPARVLIGGLGVGFSLVEAVRHRHARAVTVVEREPTVIAWHATHLAACSGGALRDPRVTVVCADLLDWLGRARGRFDAICVTAAMVEVPSDFLQWLRPGGRLFLVRGHSPVMEAVLVHNDVNGPRIESLFETDVPYLVGAAPVPQFVF